MRSTPLLVAARRFWSRHGAERDLPNLISGEHGQHPIERQALPADVDEIGFAGNSNEAFNAGRSGVGSHAC
jgi:hypothetical protein